MQIREQLRKSSIALGRNNEPLACGCDPTFRSALCRSGYHGKNVRVRFKARSRHHGNETNSGKRKKG